MKNNYSWIALFAVIALLVGGFVGSYAFPREVSVEHNNTVYLPAQSCIPVSCTPVDCKPVACVDAKKSQLSDQEIIDQVQSDTNRTYVRILTSTRSCDSWMANEKRKGTIDSENLTAPFCYRETRANNKTIEYQEDIAGGCKMAYIVGC